MTPETDPSLAGRLGVTGFVFGLVALGLCWWFPFGPVLGACGSVLSAGGWAGGDRRGRLGFVLAAGGTAAGALLAWEYWRRLFGS